MRSILFGLHRQKSKSQIIDTLPGKTGILLLNGQYYYKRMKNPALLIKRFEKNIADGLGCLD